MNELIIKIGPLFWVLSVLDVYALAVVAERILYFHRIQINTGDFLRGISKDVYKRQDLRRASKRSMPWSSGTSGQLI